MEELFTVELMGAEDAGYVMNNWDLELELFVFIKCLLEPCLSCRSICPSIF